MFNYLKYLITSIIIILQCGPITSKPSRLNETNGNCSWPQFKSNFTEQLLHQILQTFPSLSFVSYSGSFKSESGHHYFFTLSRTTCENRCACQPNSTAEPVRCRVDKKHGNLCFQCEDDDEKVQLSGKGCVATTQSPCQWQLISSNRTKLLVFEAMKQLKSHTLVQYIKGGHREKVDELGVEYIKSRAVFRVAPTTNGCGYNEGCSCKYNRFVKPIRCIATGYFHKFNYKLDGSIFLECKGSSDIKRKCEWNGMLPDTVIEQMIFFTLKNFSYSYTLEHLRYFRLRRDTTDCSAREGCKRKYGFHSSFLIAPVADDCYPFDRCGCSTNPNSKSISCNVFGAISEDDALLHSIQITCNRVQLEYTIAHRSLEARPELPRALLATFEEEQQQNKSQEEKQEQKNNEEEVTNNSNENKNDNINEKEEMKKVFSSKGKTAAELKAMIDKLNAQQ